MASFNFFGKWIWWSDTINPAELFQFHGIYLKKSLLGLSWAELLKIIKLGSSTAWTVILWLLQTLLKITYREKFVYHKSVKVSTTMKERMLSFNQGKSVVVVVGNKNQRQEIQQELKWFWDQGKGDLCVARWSPARAWLTRWFKPLPPGRVKFEERAWRLLKSVTTGERRLWEC